MDEKGKRPYYGRATKREVLQRYRTEAVSTSELAELHGIGGSNTVCRWAKTPESCGTAGYAAARNFAVKTGARPRFPPLSFPQGGCPRALAAFSPQKSC